MGKHLRFGGMIGLLLLPVMLCFGQLSSRAQISVITCGPGDELYSAFGHSALRVQDVDEGIDVIYNYGTFDFNTPNFYWKFARGKLLYTLSRQRFEDFLYIYQLENRWVREQILDLDSRQVNDIFRFLETNYLPENRDYQYDFLFDNCSTRIPDLLKAVLGESINFRQDHLPQRSSFRELIQDYLRTNTWASFGIDLALGSVIDRKASVREHMFLPDYVLLQLNNTMIDREPIVLREREILEEDPREDSRLFTLTPLFWFLMLLLFTATFTYIDYVNKTRSRWLDTFLFGITGILGVLIVFLWFFTDHTTTVYNFNIFWAFPLNLVLVFYLLRKEHIPGWVPVYILLLMVFTGLVFIFWALGIQSFAPLLPIVLLSLLLRYFFLYYHLRGLSGTKLRTARPEPSGKKS